MSKLGRLIVFEGTDGCGKSTQVHLLKGSLSALGFSVLATREPTDGTYGRRIRALYNHRSACNADEELELFLADRREHVSQLLEPALAEGKIVLCDRYFLSTAAYQGARGHDPEDILRRNHFAPDPDLALLFQLPLDLGLQRITSGRCQRPNDFEQLEELKKVAAIFAGIDRPYIRKIPASGSIDTVHNRVMAEVAPLLNLAFPAGGE
jgi:dTMP kinase